MVTKLAPRIENVVPPPCSARTPWQVVTLVKEGYQFIDIARGLRVRRNTVGRIMNLYRRTGQVVPGKSTGRPRNTTEREDRRLFTLVRRKRQKSARWLRGEWGRRLNGFACVVWLGRGTKMTVCRRH